MPVLRLVLFRRALLLRLLRLRSPLWSSLLLRLLLGRLLRRLHLLLRRKWLLLRRRLRRLRLKRKLLRLLLPLPSLCRLFRRLR